MEPYLVKFFVELRELRNFLHHLLPHEEGGVDRRVVLLDQGLQGQLDQSLLQANGRTLDGEKDTNVKNVARDL